MRDLFVLFSVLGTVPFFFLQPHVGILVWCWVSYMNPHRLTWGFAYDVQLAFIVAIATLISWLASKEPKRLQMNAVSGLMLAFIAWMTFANLFALNPEDAYYKWEQSIKILMMTLVTMILMQSRERIHALVWIIVLSLGFFGLKGGMFTLLGGGQERVYGPAGSFFEDNNALAMTLVMVVPLIRYLQLQTQSALIRWGMLFLMVATIFSIIGSHSRGAFLGGCAMLIFLWLKSRHRVALGLALCILLAASASFVPDKWIERMQTIKTYEQDTSATSRLELWTFGFRVALDRPLVGGGFRVSYDNDIFLSYMPDTKRGKTANFHSVYFEILGELGFVGLFIYLGLLLAAWRSGSWVIARARGHPDLAWADNLARMTQVSLVGFASAGAFLNLAFFDLYFHLLAILFVTRQVVANALERKSPERYAYNIAPKSVASTKPVRNHAIDH